MVKALGAVEIPSPSGTSEAAEETRAGWSTGEQEDRAVRPKTYRTTDGVEAALCRNAGAAWAGYFNRLRDEECDLLSLLN